MAKKRKKIKKRRNYFPFPIIGKYIDTPTKAELPVTYFMDDVGNYKLQLGNLPTVVLHSCRFQVKTSSARSQRKFFNKLKPYLDFSSGCGEIDCPEEYQTPLLFGLLKLRKGKTRKFVLIKSASQFYGAKLINIIAVGIDNLLYLDLLSRSKTTP